MYMGDMPNVSKGGRSVDVREQAKAQVLVIDDDAELLVLLREWLVYEGFKAATALSGSQGLRQARKACPDLIILDLMMPEMSGWATYRQLRRVCAAPIIVLTVVADERDRIRGRAMGVDDYVTKPYSFAELRIHIRSVLERSAFSDRHMVFDDGYLRIDLRDGASVRGRRPAFMTPTESRLLIYLAGYKGQVVPCEELLVNVWGTEYASQVRYLDIYVRHLCHKLGDDPAHPRYIRANHGVGYSFVGGVPG
jgi:two-component system KDP operon response regulator KdpE